ncbi:hypothetical protein [Buttiauxella brennerae]|uniref:hypothetical protein n=1 Tax=Buttiauxella TaxID=82976 RepID=UPI00286F469E|nr:hypothetical protein [Buttiauxella brennerae]
MKQKKPAGVTVLLDSDLTLALNDARNKTIAKINESGLNGMAMAPSLGALARMALRKAMGMPENKYDDLQG